MSLRRVDGLWLIVERLGLLALEAFSPSTRALSIPALLIGATVISTSAIAHDFTLESAVRYAREHNPELAAARLRIEEAQGRHTNAGRLMNPELQVGASRMPGSSEGRLGLAFMQKFPVTHRLRLEKSISAAELAAAEEEVKNEERKLGAEVRTLAVKLLYTDAVRELTEKQIANSTNLAAIATGRTAAGEGNSTEVARMELEAGELHLNNLKLDTEVAEMTGMLRPMLGLLPEEPVHFTGGLMGAVSLPVANADPQNRADYRAAGHMETAARHGVNLEHAKKYDDISVGAMVEGERVMDEPAGIQRRNMVGVQISIPLPLWNRNQGKVQEATATATRAQKEKEALALNIQAEASTARSQMAAFARVAKQTQDVLIPKSTEIEERLREQYRQGHATLEDLLRARDKHLQLEREYLDSQRDYYLARAKWLAAAGK
ncbi:MAG: Cobalt-zinc-cadmium resistance protein CzcC [Verrucomicrobiaceae bacterium]|nr:Cobalt-zinc-cadmium resistance protein CzcC [Verrucomicrobiaceae bacterium]